MNYDEKIRGLAEQVEALRAEIAELDTLTEPTEEQTARMAAALDEFDSRKSEHAALVERAEKIQTALATPALRTSGFGGGPEVMIRRDPFDNLELLRAGMVPREDMRARAFNAIEAERSLDDSAKEQATRVAGNAAVARHILLTGSPEYQQDFRRWLEDPVGYRGTALSNTDANGGYLIPYTLDPTVILTNNGSDNPFRRIARIEQTATDTWNGVTSSGVTAEWLASATEAAEAGPTFGAVAITPAKAFAEITATYEVLQDSNFEAQLPRLLMDAKDRLEAAGFATGSGTNEPKGVITAVAAVTASRVSPTTAGSFTTASIADVYKVINGLPPRHRAASTWLANYTTLNVIRQMDTYGGSSFWANLAGPTTPEQLIGLPVYASSAMTATVTTGSNLLLAGDFSEFIVVDRVGMSLSYDPNVRGSSYRHTGQGQFTAFWRVGSDVGDVNAFRLLQL